MAFRPGKFRRKMGKNGQPEGYAVTSTIRKPWVAGIDRKTWNAAGQNNSNPTPCTASAINGGWELFERMVPIIVLNKVS
jgi:hypothetical protein